VHARVALSVHGVPVSVQHGEAPIVGQRAAGSRRASVSTRASSALMGKTRIPPAPPRSSELVEEPAQVGRQWALHRDGCAAAGVGEGQAVACKAWRHEDLGIYRFAAAAIIILPLQS